MPINALIDLTVKSIKVRVGSQSDVKAALRRHVAR